MSSLEFCCYNFVVYDVGATILSDLEQFENLLNAQVLDFNSICCLFYSGCFWLLLFVVDMDSKDPFTFYCTFSIILIL